MRQRVCQLNVYVISALGLMSGYNDIIGLTTSMHYQSRRVLCRSSELNAVNIKIRLERG